jgi:HK97 family phage portal protein
MALIDNIRNLFRTEEKQAPSNMVGYFGVGSGDAKNYKYQDLAKEGYLKNAIVYRCVNEISKGAGAVDFMLKNDDMMVEEHPLLDLLNRPNPLQSSSEFFNSLFGFLLLSGNAYILKVGSEVGSPRELHLLRPDRIQIKGGGKPIPDRYEYIVNGRVQNVFDVDQDTGSSEIKHIKLWNPLDDYYGCSPLQAAAEEVDQHNLSSKHNINLLNNGARPSGAVIFKPKDDQGFTVNLSESQRQQLLTDLNNRFVGSGNAGRPMLLEGDFDWKEMGLSPKDMDFINLKHMSATDIALCFGVPSQLVGVPDSQTYSNIAEARLALYEETIIPHLKLIQSDLNEWLVPMFSEELEFCYDIDGIPALAERKRKTYENITNAVNTGIMTRNEAREIIGLSPVTGGDDLYINAALMPIGSASVEEPEDPINDEDEKEYDDEFLDDLDILDEKDELTNFPNKGDNKKISLRNSEYPQFDYDFAKNVKEVGVGKKIWTAGGNIRGNEAFMLWGRAREGSESPAVIKWIKEREAWAARHSVNDGNQFVSGSLEPNMSNVAGVVALMKWGVINPKLGQQGMKDVVLELTKKLEGRKDPKEDLEPLETDTHVEIVEDTKQVSAKVKEALKKKVDDHNEKYGDKPTKRANLRMLEAVFRRGVGAYNNNPGSVRPRVTGPDQWAYARTNSFLAALRTGRFQGGKHDQDLFPKGHPLSSKK